MSYINYKDILDQTNGGLEIITWYYPDAKEALSRKNKKFKIREEKTASASIRKKSDGNYYVTDFGGDQKERNAIGICMLETGKEFPEACVYLGTRFHITSDDANWKPSMPEIEKKPLKEGDTPGDYKIKMKDFTAEELSILGPCVDAGHCLDYGFHSVESFTTIKDNEIVVTTATEDYPIFTFHGDGWDKLYQPLSFDKQYRFRFLGEKPERFMYGQDLVKKAFEKQKKLVEEEYQASEGKGDSDPRIDRVFIVSGGSDGLNIRSFGYIAVWFNSEAELINYEEYRLLKTYAKEIIYVADLDHTGIQQAVKLGLMYLDIKIMMLPQWLRKLNDRRGNPCKDFKDFVVKMHDARKPKKFNYQLDKLIENALPCEFWSFSFQKDRRIYHIRWTQLFNFLKLQGFGRYKDEHTKDGFHYIQIDGNVVSIVRPVDIEGFVHQFLKDRQMPVELRDMAYSKSLSDRVLTKLDSFDIDFNIADKAVQYMFFSNQVWEITEEAITKKKLGEVDRYVWEKKVIDHTVHLQDAPFKIFKDAHDNWDIEILKKDNDFLNYLINTSRIHWRKELETFFSGKKAIDKEAYAKENKFNIAGPNLSEDEIYEQKLHLINKIYSYGYMLHTYKSPQRPWALYAMDSKVADISESHGGSGKSVYLKSLQNTLKNNHYINGRDSKKTQDDFIYHGVTEECDYILVDDCHRYMDYGFWYNAITGDMEVNNKNGLRYIIPFDRSPKIAFASNYPPNALDPSLERRLLFIVFSDYYHYNQDGEYEQTRAVSDDFEGKTLFKEFTEKNWNNYFNFCAYTLQFFLSQREKIDPPMGNVTKRNLLAEMGEPFKNWADLFFAVTGYNESPMNLDTFVNKIEAFEDFKRISGYGKLSAQKFKKSLKAYCKLQGWTLNPAEAGADNNGRILKNRNGQTIEMIYLQTKGEITRDDEDMDSKPQADDDFFSPDQELKDDL